MDRRFFLQLCAMATASSLVGWRFSGNAHAAAHGGAYDVIVVGAGLGGLSCAAFLAKNGFKTLLLEQYAAPGGYANSFKRLTQGREFTCEISLHSSCMDSPDMRAMLKELDVWDKLSLAPHPHAWSSRFPDFAVDIPAKAGVLGFKRQMVELFPQEANGLEAYFTLWKDTLEEMQRLEKDLPGLEESKFPEVFPNLWYIHDKTVGQLVDEHIQEPKAKAVLTQSCGYYGLPPSRLAAFYYLIPTGEYLEQGGAYLKGTSRSLSEALAASVTNAGGEILYASRVTSVMVENGKAVGVKTREGNEYTAGAVVCNASAPQLFETLLPQGALPQKDSARVESYSLSPGSFIVWLGLDKDITKEHPDPETSYFAGTDMDAGYAAAMDCNYEHAGFSMMVYDNLVPGFSPPGCSSICLVSLSGHEHWKPYEKDYLEGRKGAYHKEKKRLTDLLIARAEERALPGLSKMIVMQDSATPLTNLRYTLNTGGAIYGYNQTVDNSFMSRLPNATGVPGLFLASAWGNPGGGYDGALMGGKSVFRAVAEYLTHKA